MGRRCLKCGRKHDIEIQPSGLCEHCARIMAYLTDPHPHEQIVKQYLDYFY